MFFSNFLVRIKIKLQSISSFLKTSFKKLANLKETNFNLGLYHLENNNIYDAILRFKMVIMFDPTNAEAHYNLGKALLLNNKKEQAKREFLDSLKFNAKLEDAKYFLSVIDEQYHPPQKIPLDIIKEYYNKTNNINEDKQDIILSNIINGIKSIYTDQQNLKILELGIGNIKYAQRIKENYNNSNIIGVDISSVIIKDINLKVSNKLVYNELFEQDFYEYLKNSNSKFDIILAINSLYYNQSLEEIFELIKSNLNSKSIFIFNIEISNENKITLSESKRYFKYPNEYIEENLKKNNLNVISQEEINKTENQFKELLFICKLN